MSFDRAALFEHLPNALMVLDRNLRYVAANPAYLAITGSTREQVIGTHIFEAFPDTPGAPESENVALLRASFERVLASGKPDEVAAITYHVRRTPSGPLEKRVWSARHTPMFDDRGKVEYIIQETTDITNMREAFSSPTESDVVARALRLQASLGNLRDMFDQAPGFMCFLRGRQHVFEVVNRAYMQLVGHRDVIGLSVQDALPEVVAQGFIGLLDGVFNWGKPFIGTDIAIQLVRNPGAAPELRYLDFIYQPIRNAAGMTIGIFVQGQDVTERHESDRRQKFLIEAIPVQVWTARPDGELDFVSERVTDFFQKPASELLGQGWISEVHPDDRDDSMARWRASLETGAPYEVEFRLRRPDGAYRWHLARANAERDETGRTIRWFGTNTDIHDAKTALAEAKTRAEYEQRLIGIVSHDLRNPLNAITLAATLLQSQALPPLAEKTVARLKRSADRALHLIADLLDFAKARVGSSIPINRRPTNLREVIEQVVDELQLVAPSRVIRVGHHGDEDGSWDADRIAQVIANLVGNAIQHGSAEHPVTIASKIDSSDAVLTVCNAGPPIPETEIAELFEPFRRASNAGTAKGSMGLGLYIAREVVTAHGGTISVSSTGEAGTCFQVRLPRYEARTG